MLSKFSDPTRFPAFHELPSASASAPEQARPGPGPGEAEGEGEGEGDASSSWWCLLAQVKENMTITQPTLIATDRAGVDFALLFDGDGDGDRGAGLRGFRRGFTVAVPRARRTDRAAEGKKAVVRVPPGAGVKVIPGGLDRVLELGVVLQGRGLGGKCAACGKTEGPFLKCTGCGFAAYCGKDCQVKGWGEMDHKSNCKVLKSLKDILI